MNKYSYRESEEPKPIPLGRLGIMTALLFGPKPSTAWGYSEDEVKRWHMPSLYKDLKMEERHAKDSH